jgi:hypothetical protein
MSKASPSPPESSPALHAATSTPPEPPKQDPFENLDHLANAVDHLDLQPEAAVADEPLSLVAVASSSSSSPPAAPPPESLITEEPVIDDPQIAALHAMFPDFDLSIL